MAKVRLTVDGYDRPEEFGSRDNRATVLLRKGHVFECSGDELKRLRELGAVEDVHDGDTDADKALLDLSEATLKRARKEHEELSKRHGVSQREVDLSADRLAEAERAVERFKGSHSSGSKAKS